jgi:virginiamycin A acetyltransferase
VQEKYPSKGDTVVGHDVWIGYEATIIPGVQIGNGAVVASKAVVTRNVPAYAVVAGNPAQVVRYRFDETTIARLQALAWWHWPSEKITRHLALLNAADLDALEAAE